MQVSAPATDPGHLLPAEEWARVVAEAEAIGRGEQHRLMRLAPRAGRSAFPSITGFIPCKYDGGARPGGRPTFGVWHDAETPLARGYALAIANYFTRCTNFTSAHFMLGPEAGYQLLDTSRVAWHCGNGNPRSIGVENCGYVAFTPAQWLTADGDAQMARGATLLREIRDEHGIELRWMTDPAEILACHHGEAVGGWITHHQASLIIGGSTHTDTDPNYPKQRLMELANQEDDMPLSPDDLKAVAKAVWSDYPIGKRGGYGPANAATWLQDARIGVGGNGGALAKLIQAAPDVDEAALAQALAPLVVPAIVQAVGAEHGLTADEIEAASETAVRKVLGSLGQQG